MTTLNQLQLTNMTAGDYRVEDPKGYTQGAWVGKLYDSSLSTKEICERIRFFTKQQYPELKLSVVKRHYNAISIAVMESPYSLLVTPSIENLPTRNPFNSTNEQRLEMWKKTYDSGHINVNHFWINDDYSLNEKGKEIMNFINSICVAFNRDDSDSQIDYFDTNFYYDLSLGKWDKPFKLNIK